MGAADAVVGIGGEVLPHLLDPAQRLLHLRVAREVRGPAQGGGAGQTFVEGSFFTNSQFLANFRQNVARFRLYRHRFLQENTSFAAFFKIYRIINLKFLKFGKIIVKFANFATFAKIVLNFHENC